VFIKHLWVVSGRLQSIVGKLRLFSELQWKNISNFHSPNKIWRFVRACAGTRHSKAFSLLLTNNVEAHIYESGTDCERRPAREERAQQGPVLPRGLSRKSTPLTHICSKLYWLDHEEHGKHITKLSSPARVLFSTESSRLSMVLILIKAWLFYPRETLNSYWLHLLYP